MGDSFRYQAIPARSRFFSLLQKEKCFPLLLRDLFPHGNGVFAFLRSEPKVATKILEGTAARFPELFGSRARTLRQVEQFCAEVERTCKEFPGIEAEATFLAQFHKLIEDRLEEAVQSESPRSRGWGQKLVHGDQRLNPGKLVSVTNHYVEDSVRVVSREVLDKGSQILQRWTPSELFKGKERESRCRNEYRRWRRLYLAAADRSDVLLVREMALARVEQVPWNCPYCGATLPTDRARQCFQCGMDWHDPANVVCR